MPACAQAATLLLAAACPLAAQAVEGGVGPILPGSTATLVDLPPTQPGWVLQLNHLRYRSAAQAGARIATAKLEQRTEATMVSAFYTFEPKLWGAFFSVGANLPQVSTEVSAALVTPLGKGYASLGLEDFWLQQLEADRGSGTALLGGLKGRSVAAGPVLGYVLPLAGKEALVAELRWLKESKVKNRLEGELFWLKLAYPF